MNYSEGALGLISTRSFPAMVGTADMMLKSAAVTLVGYEKIGSGYCTAIVRGRFADVRLAVESGAEVAEQMEQLVSKLVIPRPLPNLEAILPISKRMLAFQQHGTSRLSNLAVGLLETRGLPAMIGATDIMLKSADVYFAGYETVGDGLCTAIIRGTVSNVTYAVEAGMYEAERIGELSAVMVIPRPLEDLEHTLPTAICWLEEKPQPLPILLPKTVEREVEQEVEQEQEVVMPFQIPQTQKVEIESELE
jgi:carbon dioxide concentrating mechanism protein CcmO